MCAQTPASDVAAVEGARAAPAAGADEVNDDGPTSRGGGGFCAFECALAAPPARADEDNDASSLRE